jgi:hypothetical protein
VTERFLVAVSNYKPVVKFDISYIWSLCVCTTNQNGHVLGGIRNHQHGHSQARDAVDADVGRDLAYRPDNGFSHITKTVKIVVGSF